MVKQLLLTTGLALALATPAYVHAAEDQLDTDAQESTSQKMDEQASGSGTSEPAQKGGIIAEQERDQILTKELIGKSVVNNQDEDLGTVQDLVLDQEGQVTGIVLASGGFLGIGAKPVGIAWNDLAAAMDQETLRLDLTPEQVAEAPEFKTKEQKEAEKKARDQQEQKQQDMQEQQQSVE
jgi:sporulation protein YlmC with PRC-barrel domain